ncbi:MAG: hypothetical protein P4L45_12375 [Ignavibacteriaceae bacterium]|nr:hypothetical protein [Ignavibacteriaceae bacterium]
MNIKYKKLTESQLSDIVAKIKNCIPYRNISQEYGISLSTIYKIKYEYLGRSTLKPRISIGSKEEHEIIELINTHVSYRDICKRYNIPSTATIFRIKNGYVSSLLPGIRADKRIARIKILFDSLPSSEKKNILNILENSVSGNIIVRDCQQ